MDSVSGAVRTAQPPAAIVAARSTWGCGAGLADMIADNETTANLIGWFVHRVLKALLA